MILCCGEALVDMVPGSTAAGEPAFVPHAGGSVFNTALALGRLGAPAGFLSGLSSDFFGEMLRRQLVESRVGTSHLIVSKRPTTLAFVSLQHGQASYAFYDEHTAGRMLEPEDMPQIGGNVGALFFGGISLAAEPCGSAYEALLAREQEARVTMLDPNIRPGLIGDPVVHRARMARLIAMADIVKVSDEDLSWLNEAGGGDAVAAVWLKQGPKLLVVTHGSRGATAYTRRGRISVPPVLVEVADTIGAGDTFNAGLLTSLLEQGRLEKRGLVDLPDSVLTAALDFAAKAAAVTVSRAGANPPWRSELPAGRP